MKKLGMSLPSGKQTPAYYRFPSKPGHWNLGDEGLFGQSTKAGCHLAGVLPPVRLGFSKFRSRMKPLRSPAEAVNAIRSGRKLRNSDLDRQSASWKAERQPVL